MCSAEAAKSGVYPGMKLPEARAECADLIWRECNEKLYAQAANKLLNDLVSCSPRVSLQQPGIFLLDASGLQRLGGESKMCREILKLASRCGYVDGQVGIADSAFAALVATRCKTRRWFIVKPGTDKSFLEPLPITHLPLSGELRELLSELGIRNMGQLAQLPANMLCERFGQEGQLMHNLACGLDNHQPSLPPIEKSLEAAIEIGGPIESLNDTLFLFKSMLDRLSGELRQQALCADELLVSFYNDNDKFDERNIQLIRPSNSAKFLVEIIRLTLESKPLQREFTGLRVAVVSSCQENWEQSQLQVNAATLMESGDNDPMESETALLLLQRFRTRVGEDALVCPAASDDHFIDKAGVWVPAIKGKTHALGAEAIADGLIAGDHSTNTVSALPVNAGYVLERIGSTNGLNTSFVMKRLLAPRPALVRLDQQSRPMAVTHHGQWHHVLSITAPERLSGHWWDETVRKSYYVALIERDKQSGAKLVSLVYNLASKDWQIEGVFD